MFLTVKNLGLYNNPWVMVILGATSMTNIIISRTFFETNIPNELREAAEIDGCSNTRFFSASYCRFPPLSLPSWRCSLR